MATETNSFNALPREVQSLVLDFTADPSHALIDHRFRDLLYRHVYPHLVTDWKAFLASLPEPSPLAEGLVQRIRIFPLTHSSEITPSELASRSGLIAEIYAEAVRCAQERGLSSWFRVQKNAGSLETLDILPLMRQIVANEDAALVNFFKALSRAEIPQAKQLLTLAAAEDPKVDVLANKLRLHLQKDPELFRGIVRLDLSEADLNAIPSEIRYFTGLKILLLSRNNLSVLPPEIVDLPLLDLDLSYNQLSSLPQGFGRLNLLKLFLHSNLFTSFPLELCQLRSLEELYLSANRITQIPSEARKMEALTTLDVSFNELARMPFAEGNRPPRLAVLDTDGNPFKG